MKPLCRRRENGSYDVLIGDELVGRIARSVCHPNTWIAGTGGEGLCISPTLRAAAAWLAEQYEGRKVVG